MGMKVGCSAAVAASLLKVPIEKVHRGVAVRVKDVLRIFLDLARPLDGLGRCLDEVGC